MQPNPFFRENETYTRHIDLISDAIADLSLGLMCRLRAEGIETEYDVCAKFVTEYVDFNNTNTPTFDRKVAFLNRKNFEDRVEEQTTFNRYIDSIRRNQFILAPTLTAYNNKKQKLSLVAVMLDQGVEKRAITKKDMAKAKAEGLKDREKFLDSLQTAFKLSNNSSSGAKSSAGTPLFLPSGHPSLTSTCRSATSYANAMNEQFIAGNRHYHSAEVTINNIINRARLTNLGLLDRAIREFNLHIVSVKETFECVISSSTDYWNDKTKEDEIYQIIRGMDDLQRCAVVYVGDLHHLAKYNPEMVRTFFAKMSYMPSTPVNDGIDYLSMLDADQRATVALICAKYSAGKQLGAMVKNNDPNVGYVQAVAKNLLDTLHEYDLIIGALWMTRNMPPSMARLPNIVRKTAIVSDTDSTIFTVQEWTKWYTGSYNFSQESNNVAWVVIYLSSQLIAHVLAMMSANMGVGVEDIKRIAMKNEYAFPVLGLCTRAKHYFAYQGAREGDVYEKFHLEQKGVGLRNANTPPRIAKRFKHFVYYVLDGIFEKQKLDYFSIIKQLVEIETSIIRGIMKGSSEFLASAQIKDKGVYKVGEAAPQWKQYLLWSEVFAETYGDVGEPPYMAVKLSLDLRKRADIDQWVERFQNKNVRDRMKVWVKENAPKELRYILIPKDIAVTSGIPEEILEAADYRKIVFSIMEAFYLTLESMGIFINKLKQGESVVRRLITDYYTEEMLADYEVEQYKKQAADTY